MSLPLESERGGGGGSARKAGGAPGHSLCPEKHEAVISQPEQRPTPSYHHLLSHSDGKLTATAETLRNDLPMT